MKYPYIGKGLNSGSVVLIYAPSKGVTIEAKTRATKNNQHEDSVDESFFKEITHEYLANTYGEVVSPERAEFIIELCKVGGIDFVASKKGISKFKYFKINESYLGFYTEHHNAKSQGFKKITIPLTPKESVVEWKEGAVCFAGGSQFKTWDINRGELITVDNVSALDFETVLSFKDFQLNTIKQRDSIKVSELDTEQKYNDAVKVFELFGHERSVGYNTLGLYDFCFIAKNGHIGGCSELHLLSVSHRKITFNQLMAIGELKRLELKGGNEALSSDEETELKSRAMASELNSQSNDDEWPKIGDEVVFKYCKFKIVAKYNQMLMLATLDDCGFALAGIKDCEKPKTPEDLLIEELQTKLVKNNAVDNWMLAANIISGDIEGLTYNSKDGK